MFMHIFENFYNIMAPKEHCMWHLMTFKVEVFSFSLARSLLAVFMLDVVVANLIKINFIYEYMGAMHVPREKINE